MKYLLSLTLILACSSVLLADKPLIIDCHTHFKGAEQIAHEAKTTKRDPRDTLGKVIVPGDYRPIADRLGIRSTLIVEAVQQDRPDFNDWVLAESKSDLVCGYVARGDLNSQQFQKNYRRYQASGYLKGYRLRFEELESYLKSETGRANLAILQRDGMVVDLLIEPNHAKDVIRCATDFPRLKLIINHCFRARMKAGVIDNEWKEAIKACSKFPNVHCKFSSIVNFGDSKPFDEQAPTELAYYLPVLDPCYQAFGPDRLIFGTNWGVCDHFGKVDDVVRLAGEFLNAKGEDVYRKVMYQNAIKFYNIDEKHLR